MKKWLLVLLLFIVFTTSFTSAADPKMTIICEEGAQFEFVSPEGIRVFADVISPEFLTAPPATDDILVINKTEEDQYLQSFAEVFPGGKLITKTGVLERKGVKVTGIASSQNPYGEFLPEGGSNYIFLIEMGGLRIAHLGTIGQKQLTEDQLGILGKIDIALIQLANPFSGTSFENRKAFNLIDQLKPELVIPTNIYASTETEAILKFTAKKWQGFYTGSSLEISKTDLTALKTKVLFMGSWGKICKGLKIAKKWPSN